MCVGRKFGGHDMCDPLEMGANGKWDTGRKPAPELGINRERRRAAVSLPPSLAADFLHF